MRVISIIGIIFFSLSCLLNILSLVVACTGKKVERDVHIIADIFWLIFFIILLNWV